MDSNRADKIKIKEEIISNDQEDMDSENFVKEDMVFVDMALKQEEFEHLEADPLKNSMSAPNKFNHEGIPGSVTRQKETANYVTRRATLEGLSSKKKKLPPSTIPERKSTRTVKVPKQYSSTAFESGPANRRKHKSGAEDAECEPSTTSAKKRATAVSGSSNQIDYFEKATSSKHIHEGDNDEESDNADDQDDDDDDEDDEEEDELDDDEMEEADDPENSSYPSADNSLTGERYMPKPPRTIPPYKDTNSTHSDERIFCHDCCREWESDCPRHGPLIVVEDTPIPADINDALRAIKTAPPQLTVSKSKIPKAGCGVHAAQPIPGRIRFGPYQGKIVPPALATSYAWLIRKNGKADHCVDATEPGCSNWMRYVNCSRTDEERNIEAFQFRGKLYYKTLRPVALGEELLVSYGEAYERQLCQLEKEQTWEGLESSAENYSLPSGLLGSLGDVSWSLPPGEFDIWDACAAQVTSTSNSSDDTGARKQAANSSNWRRTLSKEALDRGLEHINARGQPIRARKLGPNCGAACRFKCHSRMSEDSRLVIFNMFWGIGNHTGQWEFIAKHCELYQPKQRKKDAIRPISASRKYFFRIGGEIIYVCKRMFCNTLDISEKWVHTALKRKLDDETVAPDRRGKHPKIGKVLKSVKDSVRTHIRLIPQVDTVVGRSIRQYVEEGLTVRAMYRLYSEWMDQNAPTTGGKPQRKASERQYRDIFLAELNVGFFKRAKDECSYCERYDEGDAEVKKQMQSRYDIHFGNKEALKELRAKDRAEIAPVKEPLVPAPPCTTCYACFDLLKVFGTPKTDNSELHYRKKLSVYNFNVYDTANHECFCYLWDEGIARAGEDEIASCLLSFIQIQFEENGMVDFRFYSGSSDLTKNKYLFSLYCYVAAKYGVTVTHRFFEWGHTQNESDGVIGVIERASKGQDIYVPSQWYDIVKEAKKTGKPYRVIPSSQGMVFNFRRLARNLQWSRDTSGGKIRWNQVKEVVVTNEQVTVRYNLAGERCIVVPVQAGCPVEVSSCKLEHLYDEPLAIRPDKYHDLMALCKSLVIPPEYHEFYQSFRSSPDVQEAPRRYYNDADISEEGVLSDNFDDSDND